MWLDILGGSLEYSWLKRTKDVEMCFWPTGHESSTGCYVYAVKPFSVTDGICEQRKSRPYTVCISMCNAFAMLAQQGWSGIAVVGLMQSDLEHFGGSANRCYGFSPS